MEVRYFWLRALTCFWLYEVICPSGKLANGRKALVGWVERCETHRRARTGHSCHVRCGRIDGFRCALPILRTALRSAVQRQRRLPAVKTATYHHEPSS